MLNFPCSRSLAERRNQLKVFSKKFLKKQNSKVWKITFHKRININLILSIKKESALFLFTKLTLDNQSFFSNKDTPEKEVRYR